MKKIIKKTLVYMLSTVMCISSINMQAFAEEIVGNETSSEEKTDTISAGEIGGTVSENEIESIEPEIMEEVPKNSGWDGKTTEKIYEDKGYKITYVLNSHWDTGYTARIKVENIGSDTVQDWSLVLEGNIVISEIWNAKVVFDDENYYIVKNAGWNQDIAPGNSIEFGISGNHAFTDFPEACVLLGETSEVKAENYTIEYRVDSDWENGFYGYITIINTSDRDLEDWVLEFDFDREITNVWDSVMESKEGGHYMIRNAAYNSTITPGAYVMFGIKGYGGKVTDEPENMTLYSHKINQENVVTFLVCAEDVSHIPEPQTVRNGAHAVKPANPVRNGYYFVGWYEDQKYSELFDFDNTAIMNDVTLYARWLDYLCGTDSDNDGIVDSLEEYFGTDLYCADTDSDGLSDYEEVYIVGSNPLSPDTDNNGIDDFKDDIDGDGICNGDEVRYGTNPLYSDTDNDNISDYDEIYVYYTNPANRDTDGDGAPDGWEILNGYDPLTYNKSFMLSTSHGIINEATPVIAKVNVEVYDADVETLKINKVKPHDNCYITPAIAGYLGDAYDFTLEGKFDKAELIFEYDQNIGKISKDFQPRIYYFNEETKLFEELENQIVENGKITAVTTHFSTYILLNKVEFDKVWNTEIKSPAEGSNLNIAFVIDLSGSMRGTKLTNTKIAVNSFIDALDDKDEAALISFTSSAVLRCGMTGDKAALKKSVNKMETGGLTSIYTGIGKALEVFESSDTTRYNMIIVFTDGYDEPSTSYNSYYKELVELTNQQDVFIYTIGIGTIDEVLLTKVAEATGGNYYYVSVIRELQEKVDELKEEAIDYVTDSNQDGISDYHTKLIKEGKLLLSNSSNELMGVDLNYDENGNLSADWDGDGLKNGEEIKVVEKFGRTYLEMTSHPLREYSDSDFMNDYEEVQNGTDPLRYDIKKFDVDRLCTDGFYYFETTAGNLRDDDFVKGMIDYSAIINGIWNKQELYRDLIIDYYSTYVTQDVIDDVTTEEAKKLWYDALVELSDNANQYVKEPYDITYNINKLISYVNGVTDAKQLKGDFINRASNLIIKINQISEDATELRFDVSGLEYVKKYCDGDVVKRVVGSSQKALQKCSDGISFLMYGADIVDTITNLSQIEANKLVFSENIKTLELLSLFGSDNNISAAADAVMDILAEEYLQVYINALKGDALESGGDLLLYSIASSIGYVAIVVAVRDVMNLLIDSKTDVKQMYRTLCYSDICEVYSMQLFWMIEPEDNHKYYFCYDQNHVINITRDLKNIAQLRILGEQEYYNFVKTDGILGFIANAFNDLEKLKSEIEDTISDVKQRAEALRLHLSSAIRYSVQ